MPKTKTVKPREHIMGVRLSHGELADVEKAAARDDRRPSDWVRTMAVRAAKNGERI